MTPLIPDAHSHFKYPLVAWALLGGLALHTAVYTLITDKQQREILTCRNKHNIRIITGNISAGRHTVCAYTRVVILFSIYTPWAHYSAVHRALCCLFRPDTDGTCVSKCGQLSQQTRRLDPMLFQCWSSAVGGGPILKQHWVKCSRLLGSTQVSVYTHPSATIIFSPADQGTFSKTAGQSQAHYNRLEIVSGGNMTSTICTF